MKLQKIKAASEELGLSTYALRKMIKEGRVPFIQAGGLPGSHMLVDTEAVLAALAQEAANNQAAQQEVARQCREG